MGLFFAPRVWTPDTRLPSFLGRLPLVFLVGQSIPLPFLPLPIVSVPDLTLARQVPPRHRMSHPAIGIGHPVSAPPPRFPAHVRPPAPRSHGAVFGILHTPYGIRNSEFQNRESGNPESWCGRVGQSKQSCSKRRYPPFRSLHSIRVSNALLDPSKLQQSTSISIHHNHLIPDTS